MLQLLASIALFFVLLQENPTTAHWPQFRGPKSNAVADNPNLPETLEQNRKHRLETRAPRPRLVFAGRLGKPRLRDDRLK